MFSIRFKLIREGLHVSGLVNTYGSDYIKCLEESLNIKIKDLKDIDIEHTCPISNVNTYYLYLNDYLKVRQVNEFEFKDDILVYVPPYHIGKYLIEDIKVKRKFFKKTYKVEFKIDTDQLFKDWIEAGQPEFWCCRKKELTEEINLKTFVFKLSPLYKDKEIGITADTLHSAFCKAYSKTAFSDYGNNDKLLSFIENIVEFRIED